MSKKRRPVRRSTFPLPAPYGSDRERGCNRKDAYPTQEHARSVAIMRGMQAALSTYQCRYCGMWHLTRRRPEMDDHPELWE